LKEERPRLLVSLRTMQVRVIHVIMIRLLYELKKFWEDFMIPSESYTCNNDTITLRAEEVLGRFYDTCFHLKLYHESVFVG